MNSSDGSSPYRQSPNGEIIMNDVSAWISFVCVIFYTFVYCVDYYFVKLPLDRANTAGGAGDNSKNSASKTTRVWVGENTWEAMVKRVIKRIAQPNTKDLHYLILASFISTIFYGLFTALDANQGDVGYTTTMAWFTSLDISLYAVVKAIQTTFFIVRYQLASAKDLQSPNKLLIPGLWFLNVFAFCCMFASLFSNPPYVEMISERAGFATTILFIIADSSANIIVLYMLISPLSAHVRENKQRLEKEGKLSTTGGVAKTSLDSRRTGFRSEQDELDRIIKVETIIKTATIACAISVSLTMVENIVYCLAFYVYPDTYSSEGYNIWEDLYTWTSVVELIFCSLTPVYNYPRFKEMWRLEGLWKMRKGFGNIETPLDQSERATTSTRIKTVDHKGSLPQVTLERKEGIAEQPQTSETKTS
jgi:hypothetical protein